MLWSLGDRGRRRVTRWGWDLGRSERVEPEGWFGILFSKFKASRRYPLARHHGGASSDREGQIFCPRSRPISGVILAVVKTASTTPMLRNVSFYPRDCLAPSITRDRPPDTLRCTFVRVELHDRVLRPSMMQLGLRTENGVVKHTVLPTVGRSAPAQMEPTKLRRAPAAYRRQYRRHDYLASSPLPYYR